MAFYAGGQGEPVLLLHGWPETAYAWHEVMPRLAQRFRVIVPDLPGAGSSSTPPSPTKASMARTLAAFMSQLGHERFAVAGHDIGGMTAYPLAAQFPQRVTHVAILDVFQPAADVFDQLPLLGPGAATSPVWHFALHDVPDLPEQLVAGREDTYLDFFFRQWSSSAQAYQERLAPLVPIYAEQYRRPDRLRNGFDWYRAFLDDAQDNARLAAGGPLPMPVLSMPASTNTPPDGPAGEERDIQTRQLRGLARDVTRAPVTGTGHLVMEEDPDQVARTLDSFLAR